MPKHEITVVPQRLPAAQHSSPPVPQSHRPNVGLIGSVAIRVHSHLNAKAAEALTRLHQVETALTIAQTDHLYADIQKRNALALHRDVDERLGHELTQRRMQRVEEYRQLQHQHEVNEARRIKELLEAETETTQANAQYTLAKTVLVDAEQQLRAQKAYGYDTYKIAHKKKQVELLELELSKAEKKALLNERANPKQRDASEVDELLYEYRDRLNASGLNASRIDEILKARNR